ncbi:hypothetical protein GCM10009080_57010 [Cupriavidus pauculus]
MERRATKKSTVGQALSAAIRHELVELRCNARAAAFRATGRLVQDAVGAALEAMPIGAFKENLGANALPYRRVAGEAL